MTAGSALSGALSFVGIGLGIIVSFITMGLVQEKVTQKTYEEGLKNDLVYLPVLLQTFFCLIISFAILSSKKKEHNIVFERDMILSSLANFAGLCCNNFAVIQIDYLLLTLIKSPKSLSIVAIALIVGVFRPHKEKQIERDTIINVVIFSIGILLFNYAPADKNAKSSSTIGIIMCALGTLLDATSGYFQIDIRKSYKPSPFMFMMAISLHTFYCAAGFFFFTGEYSKAFRLFSASSDAILDQTILTITNILGLLFIFLGLSHLGPIRLAFITSSRKVFSVIASIFFFSKPVGVIRLVGIIFVLAGMIKENFFNNSKHNEPKEKDGTPANTKHGKGATPRIKDKHKED